MLKLVLRNAEIFIVVSSLVAIIVGNIGTYAMVDNSTGGGYPVQKMAVATIFFSVLLLIIFFRISYWMFRGFI
jgi:hypothetical protein